MRDLLQSQYAFSFALIAVLVVAIVVSVAAMALQSGRVTRQIQKRLREDR